MCIKSSLLFFFVPSTSTVDFVHPSLRHDRYSVSTNFRLELIELSARDFFVIWSREMVGQRLKIRRSEHGSNLARHETASELENTVEPQPLLQAAQY